MQPSSSSSIDAASRLAALETAMRYESRAIERIDARLTILEGRPERAPSRPIDKAGLAKVIVAVALPALVWITTGSIERAVTAARLMTGP